MSNYTRVEAEAAAAAGTLVSWVNGAAVDAYDTLTEVQDGQQVTLIIVGWTTDFKIATRENVTPGSTSSPGGELDTQQINSLITSRNEAQDIVRDESRADAISALQAAVEISTFTVHNFNDATLFPDPFEKDEAPFDDGARVIGTDNFIFQYSEALAALQSVNAEVGSKGQWVTPQGGHEYQFVLGKDVTGNEIITAIWPKGDTEYRDSNLTEAQTRPGMRWKYVNAANEASYNIAIDDGSHLVSEANAQPDLSKLERVPKAVYVAADSPITPLAGELNDWVWFKEGVANFGGTAQKAGTALRLDKDSDGGVAADWVPDDSLMLDHFARVQILSQRYQMMPGQTNLQTVLNQNDEVGLTRGQAYVLPAGNPTMLIKPKTVLDIPMGTTIQGDGINPIAHLYGESSFITGHGDLIGDGAYPHGRLLIGPKNHRIYEVIIDTVAGSPNVVCPNNDMQVDPRVTCGFRDGDINFWEYYAVLTNVVAGGFTLDRPASSTQRTVCILAVGIGGFTSPTRCSVGDIRIKGSGGINVVMASAPQGTGAGTFMNDVDRVRSEGADVSVRVHAQANNNAVFMIKHLAIQQRIYELSNISGFKVLFEENHQCHNVQEIMTGRSLQNCELRPAGEPGSSGLIVRLDENCKRNSLVGFVNASGTIENLGGDTNRIYNLAKDFSSVSRQVPDTIQELDEMRSYQWWLAPQDAAPVWPNRGAVIGDGDLAVTAVVPTTIGGHTPIDTSADGKVALPANPFDLSITGKATIAIAFRYTGIGTSSANPRLIEGRGATGIRALIDAANNINYSIAGATTLSGSIGPIENDKDYILFIAFLGGDKIEAELRDTESKVVFYDSKGAASLGDATPDIAPSFMGTTAGKFVSGELGDIVIDNVYWNLAKRELVASSLTVRPSNYSYYRASWEAIN